MEVASSNSVVYSCAWSAFNTCQIIFTRMEVLDCNFDSLLDLWDCCTRAKRIPPVVSFCFLCHFRFGFFFFPILIIPFGLVDVCMCSDLIWVVKWSGKFLLFMPFLFWFFFFFFLIIPFGLVDVYDKCFCLKNHLIRFFYLILFFA